MRFASGGLIQPTSSSWLADNVLVDLNQGHQVRRPSAPVMVPVGMSDLLDDWMWSPDAARWTPEDADVADPNHPAVISDPVAASLMESAIRRTADYIAAGYAQRFILGIDPDPEDGRLAGGFALCPPELP